ncbi:hypothetical protein IMZ48_04930 [Candidatus Bathyarchaeota archaeon]|nr:hypothetical protein [Candidatus Bathyarchaeota archaeon]
MQVLTLRGAPHRVVTGPDLEGRFLLWDLDLSGLTTTRSAAAAGFFFSHDVPDMSDYGHFHFCSYTGNLPDWYISHLVAHCFFLSSGFQVFFVSF